MAYEFMNWKEIRQTIADRYIKGEGIEIGALFQPLPVSPDARVKYVDIKDSSALKNLYRAQDDAVYVDVDIIDDGEKLSTIADGTQDFVIANHFLEHCQNPILAVENMIRVLKPSGILYLSIPDKNYTFDKNRPVTSLDHCLRDYKKGPEWSRDGHYEEVIRLVENITARKELLSRKKILMETGYSIHFHVWSQLEMMELLLCLRRKLNMPFKIELFLANEFEVIIILRKIY